jgi:hypothetical protein
VVKPAQISDLQKVAVQVVVLPIKKRDSRPDVLALCLNVPAVRR